MLGLLLALSGAIAGTAHASDATPATTERLQALDGQILTRLNATRAAHGLRPLVVSDALENAAVAHSRELIQAGVFQHDSPDGTSFVQRLKHFYSPSGYSSWTAGENLLYNTADIDAETAIRAWLDSPPHRENMLNPDWREVGIGSVHASTAGGTFGGAPTWVITMDFGARTGGTKAATKAPVSVKAVAAKKKATAKKKAKKHAAVHAKKPAQGEAQAEAQADGRPRRIPRVARRTSRPWQAHPTRSTRPRSATGQTRARTLHPEARSSLPCRRRPSRHRPLPSPSLLGRCECVVRHRLRVDAEPESPVPLDDHAIRRDLVDNAAVTRDQTRLAHRPCRARSSCRR